MGSRWSRRRRRPADLPGAGPVVVRLVDACPSAVRVLRAEESPTTGDLDRMASLALHLLELAFHDRTDELVPVLEAAEAILSDDDPDSRQLVAVGLFEDLQNLTSHADVPVSADAFVPHLGPRGLDAWQEVEGRWVVAAEELERDGTEPALTVQELQAVTDPALRFTIQLGARSFPSGRVVTVNEVLRWEAEGGV